jgi:hypothetical protein
MCKTTAQYDDRRSNSFRSGPFLRSHAHDRQVNFLDLGSPQAPDNIPGKVFLSAQPYLLSGAMALNDNRMCLDIGCDRSQNYLPFFEIFDICEAELASGMESQNVLRWFTATFNGVKVGKSISFRH